MELSETSHFVPCCSDWLKPEYFLLPEDSGGWNAAAAQKLRQSILDGSYSFCRTDVCPFPAADSQDTHHQLDRETPLTEEQWNLVRGGVTKLPFGPTSLAVTVDARCNLACPSCRSEPIVTARAPELSAFRRIEEQIHQARQSLQILKLAGDGEVFFSPWLKSLIQRIQPELFPHFREIHILSNGLLFDSEMYESLLPGSRYIQRVNISIDAGNESTYRKVRGGNWSRLLQNLKWIGEQRQKGLFQVFQINFTVQRNNFESMPDFVQLGIEVGATHIKFTPLLPFQRMKLDYRLHAVHLPSHPLHQKLFEIWSRLPTDSRIQWNLPHPCKPTPAPAHLPFV